MRGDACLMELRRRGVPPGMVVPPTILFAWRMGVDVSPPFMWPAAARMVFLALPLSVSAFAAMLALDVFVRHSVVKPWVYPAMSLFLGLVSGVAYSVILWVYRHKLRGVPDWRDLA